MNTIDSSDNSQMMSSELSISSNIISVGNARFIRECAIPTIEDLEAIATANFEAVDLLGLAWITASVFGLNTARII